MLQRLFKFLLVALMGVALGYVCLFVFVRSPWGMCVDIFSGHVPEAARARFVGQVVDTSLRQDYKWLASISSTSALDMLKAHRNQITANYKIRDVDETFGSYDIQVIFDNGTIFYLTVDGSWAECPDFDVTDAKIFQRLKLSGVILQTSTQ